MSGTTWTKFFWSDWESDPALRLCSLAAQGLWMRMLCIAAAHDPIGYVAVAGRALDETSIARMTGGRESEVPALLAELERNGVFSRDRLQRIYSRRMVEDAKKAAIAKRNGKLGGNPTLGKDRGKHASDNRSDKPLDKGRLKPQKPYSRRKVDPQGSNLSSDERARAAPEGRASLVWSGPPDVWAAVVDHKGEGWARDFLVAASWRDLPDRAVVCRSGSLEQEIKRSCTRLLSGLGVAIVREDAA